MLDLEFDEVLAVVTPPPVLSTDPEEQGSDGWHAKRSGKFTGSGMQNLLAVSKRDGSPLKARSDYIWQVAIDRLTGRHTGDRGTYKATQWGHDVEPHARAAYEAYRGVLTEQTDFIVHPALPYVGCSPDALVIESVRIVGGCEIKCPHDSRVHLETLLNGMPEEHEPQVGSELWITGADWWDFVSFDPRMPPHLQLYVERRTPDPDYFARLDSECRKANEEVEQLLQEINQRKEAA